MKQANHTRSTWLGTALLTSVLALSLALSASAQGRSRPRGDGEGGSGGGTAVPRGTPAPSPSPSPSPAPTPSSDAGSTQRRAPGASGSSGGTESGTATARPRQGRPVAGTAVPRGSVPAPTRTTTVFVPAGYYGGYWPWGFGGLGFGSYYYGAFDPYYGGYAPGYVTSGADGSMRLKVKPRDAQVYVDGFYAGIVDDFDGIFQRLHLEPGAHHIEVRADGYEPLSLDVQIRPGQTTKFEGDLTKAQ